MFTDNGKGPEIAGYPSTKEILHTGMASQEAEVGRMWEEGQVASLAFFPRGVLMRLVLMYTLSCIYRDNL